MEHRKNYMTAHQLAKLGEDTPRRHDICREILGVARPGKTAQDKASGAVARRLANRAKRDAWRRQHNQVRDNKNFPVETCNGKKNRFLH